MTSVEQEFSDRPDWFDWAMAQPHDDAVAHLGLDRADTPVGSFLAVDAFGKTSAERIWAAGNVVDPGATVPMSSGAGARVGGMVNMALVADDAARARAEVAACAGTGLSETWRRPGSGRSGTRARNACGRAR